MCSNVFQAIVPPHFELDSTDCGGGPSQLTRKSGNPRIVGNVTGALTGVGDAARGGTPSIVRHVVGRVAVDTYEAADVAARAGSHRAIRERIRDNCICRRRAY